MSTMINYNSLSAALNVAEMRCLFSDNQSVSPSLRLILPAQTTHIVAEAAAALHCDKAAQIALPVRLNELPRCAAAHVSSSTNRTHSPQQEHGTVKLSASAGWTSESAVVTLHRMTSRSEMRVATVAVSISRNILT